mmetsp:Transcript_51282/g.121529  ORF Transcript_51282/g.121529 Transcript_51282/m.121529 type:complete len:265 (-) Transcript_51282:226-1020(-)
MVRPGEPEGRLALHAVEPRKDILKCHEEGVPHVEAARDVRRGHRKHVRLLLPLLVRGGLEEARSLPPLVQLLLHKLRVVLRRHLVAAGHALWHRELRCLFDGRHRHPPRPSRRHAALRHPAAETGEGGGVELERRGRSEHRTPGHSLKALVHARRHGVLSHRGHAAGGAPRCEGREGGRREREGGRAGRAGGGAGGGGVPAAKTQRGQAPGRGGGGGERGGHRRHGGERRGVHGGGAARQAGRERGVAGHQRRREAVELSVLRR